MKKLKLSGAVLLCILVLSLSIIGCGDTQTSTTKPTAATGKTYNNDQHDFSCRYPADWDLQEDMMGTLVLFAGPMTADNDFMVNINIVVEELYDYPDISLDDYTEISDLQFQESLDDYQKLAVNDIAISGTTARLITYSFGIETITIKGTQAFFIRNNIAYIITYSATPDSYDDYYSDFELVLDSFNF